MTKQNIEIIDTRSGKAMRIIGWLVFAIALLYLGYVFSHEAKPVAEPRLHLNIGAKDSVTTLAPPDDKEHVHITQAIADPGFRLILQSADGKVTFDQTEEQLRAAAGPHAVDRLEGIVAEYSKSKAAESPVVTEGAVVAEALSLARTSNNTQSGQNNMWVLICFILIFMMQPGFAFLEAGLIRSTNVINVLFKNTIDTCISGIFFLVIGYSLMWNTSVGSTAWHGSVDLGWLSPSVFPNGIYPSVHFLFQLAFAMTAGTIISGGVAGRINLWAYIIITAAMSIFIYPISGSWAWSDTGWLKLDKFHDFAGCSVVHCVGGFAGLAGIILLGPRIARFRKDDPILLRGEGGKFLDAAELGGYNQAANKPHSVALATLGTFLLWMGWFGFNGGSTLAMHGVDSETGLTHAEHVGQIILNTLISGCAGGFSALIASAVWTFCTEEGEIKFDLEDVLNGTLGGLVSITASCDLFDNPLYALGIGAFGGILVFATTAALQEGWSWFKLDDPVGVIAVHAVCGTYGTLVCSLSPRVEWQVQLMGVLYISTWSFLTSYAVFWVLGRLGWLRATAREEIEGLDRSYHGKSAYRI